MEFYTGLALFQTHDNLEHLAMMEMVMGKMPNEVARAGARSKPEFFKDGAKLDWPKAKASRQSKKDVRATRPLSVSPDVFHESLVILYTKIGRHRTTRSYQQAFPKSCPKASQL